MTAQEREFAKGASASLNGTITEIMNFLRDDGRRPGGSHADLRGFLHEKLADLAEHWYKRGVRRGHIESYKEFADSGRLRTKLRYKGDREFFSGEKRRVRVTSKIRQNNAPTH